MIRAMFEWPMVSALVALAAAVGAGGRAVFDRFLGRAITDTNVITKIKEAHALADSAYMLAQTAIGKSDLYQRELQEHRVEDARAFAKLEAYASANSHAIADAENRITEAMNNIATQIGGITRRIDDLMIPRRSGS
jgi:hypothetical protein